ncbi:MAG: hypothetical protein HQK57_10920, partial [Deltaproteobacteria bacterium]|nr:hypothetical protein [Deltaproteobacteria bacterium]
MRLLRIIIIPILLAGYLVFSSGPVQAGARDADNRCAQGLTYLKAEDYGLAIACFSESFEINHNVEALINRSVAYQRLGMYEQSLADLFQAVDLDPSQPKIHLQLSR